MKRLLLCLWLMLLPAISLLAERGDYSGGYFDDSVPSHSRSFYIIWGIIGAICLISMTISVAKSKKHNATDKGCLIVFFIGLAIICALCLPRLLT